MKNGFPRGLIAAMLVAILCFVAGSAAAQATAPLPDAADVPALVSQFVAAVIGHGVASAVSIGLVLVAFGTRFLTSAESDNPRIKFLHTPAWTWWSTIGVAVLTLISKAVEAHGFSAPDIASAVVAGLLTGGLMTNPSFAGVGAKPIQASNQGGFARVGMMMILAAVGMLAACACWRPADPAYNSERCVIARQSVDCTTDAAKGEVGRGASIAINLIQSGTFDTGTLIQALLNLGFKDGECILASVAGDLNVKLSASPNEAAFLKSWSDYRNGKRKGVVYKMPAPAGR